MPRPLPPLADNLAAEITKAENFVVRLELAHSHLSIGKKNPQVGVNALEMSYELAYLRIFLAWEEFLEQSFLRLLCGYEVRGRGPEPLLAGKKYVTSIQVAETSLLGGKNYMLWHSPQQIIRRAQQYFVGSNFEQVISSASPTIAEYAAVRHRIAHSQRHAQQEFDNATMNLSGRRYPASRPGRFLRDWEVSPLSRRRWLLVVSQQLLGLAKQICP